MILIQEILISSEIVEEKFKCNLKVCKGACCVEGDWGAPLESQEMEMLDDILDLILPYLSTNSQGLLKSNGPYYYVQELKKYGVTLHDDGVCAFAVFDNEGIAQCGIENAYNDGAIEFKKPISCHLYPIRVERNKDSGFEALNYDRWDICKPACAYGQENNLAIFEFAEEALIRAYGCRFYDELKAAVDHINDE